MNRIRRFARDQRVQKVINWLILAATIWMVVQVLFGWHMGWPGSGVFNIC